MAEYLELQSVIKNSAAITDVENKNNRIYFKIDGHQFSTFGNNAYHENHPLYAHIISDIWAAKHNTAEGIEEEENNAEQFNNDLNLWYKHKTALYKLIFIKAVEILAKKGEEKFIEFVDHHFFITEEGENCSRLLKMLEASDNS